MSTPIDSVIILSRALDQTGDVLADIHSDQLSSPTPCSDWDVGRLVSHVVADPRHFLEMADGGTPDWSAEPGRVMYWAATFRSAADDLIHRWHQAGDAADPRSVDWQTAEFAVHTWDLARATGQTEHLGRLDPEVAERALAFMTASLTDDNRGGAFGAEQPVPADAPVYDRLAAYAGRPLA
jgi:uncharacterized protein (TIGR03086 family)